MGRFLVMTRVRKMGLRNNEVAATHQHSHTLIAFPPFNYHINESYFSLKQRIYVKEHDDNRSKSYKTKFDRETKSICRGRSTLSNYL